MRRQPELHLYEDVMLLSLKDAKGTLELGAHWQQAVAGALLAELLLSGRLVVERKGKKVFAQVADRRSLGDPLLDECLERVVASKKRQQLRIWVQRFSNLKKLHHRIAGQLCRRGILKQDEDKVLLLFRRRIYPEIDPRPEREIRARLERAITAPAREVAPRTVVLTALAHHAGILGAVFGKKWLKPHKKRIKEIVAGDVVGAATREAVQVAVAAAYVPIFIATT
jgi:Golgi phosphoprotein 3